MATMNEDGDMTCPLCTEKMDLTDQQLKACKCGYEICVWCWHRIIGMAEKDNTEGRCPACRTPYNKERIVSTAANCERKQKFEKAKSKTSAEARMHLSSVRVVRRKVVYIIGLPINLSDESLLERKEYFGQYGKVLKVSISRPTGATAQNASIINTFSVYITYGHEEEAIRCIQAVHNFVLEGKPLRACFGTAKYCHAWLRNMTCNNRNCLFLHEMGRQEESFNKDEIVSAYTRSRVPKIPSTYLQQRFGDVLPPPVDGYSICVPSDKIITKSATNNDASNVRDSNSHAGKSITVLPAAASWGLHRAANFCQPVGSISCSQTSSRQKGKSPDSPSVHSSVTAARQISTWHDENVKASSVSDMSSLSRPLGPLKTGVRRDCSTTVSDVPSEILQVEACASDPWDDDIPIASNIPEERHVVHMSGAQPAEPATCNAFGDTRRTISNASSRTISDASSSSIMSKTSSSAYSTLAHDDKETGLFDPGSTENMMHMAGARTVEPANSSAAGELRASGLDAASMMVNYASPTLNSLSYSDVVHLVPEPQDKGKDIVVPQSNANLVYDSHDTLDKQGISSCPDEAPCNRSDDDGSIRNLCTDRYPAVGNPPGDEHVSPVSNFSSAGMAKNLPSGLEQCSSDNRFEGFGTVPFTRTSYVLSSIHASRESSDWSSSNLDYPVGAASYISSQDDDFRHDASLTSGDSWTMNIEKDMFPVREDESILFTEDKSLSNFCKSEEVLELAEKNLTGEKVKSLGRFDGGANFDKKTSLGVAGSSIISSDLSLDFDPWDDSLSSAISSLKLLCGTNKEDDSLPLSTMWKSPNSNQSRFSFAREENPLNQRGSIRELSAIQKPLPLLHDSCGDRHQNSIRFGAEGSYAINRGPVVSSVGHSGEFQFEHSDLSWAKISAPPGFSSTNKAPPGFSFQDKCENTYQPVYSENSLHNSLGHQYQVQQSDNLSGVEYIDPEILTVGGGHMPVGSVSSHQSRRISDHIWGRPFPSNDAYSGTLPVPDNCNSLFTHFKQPSGRLE